MDKTPAERDVERLTRAEAIRLAQRMGRTVRWPR
jgi:hypothetical protein